MGRLILVVGMQYGSEGKGQIAHLLASVAAVMVRTGGPNAGHTVRPATGIFKMRQIPCGFVHPATQLVLGPGALIDLEVLRAEIALLESAGYRLAGRTYVHERAVIITDEHRELERRAALKAKIGSQAIGVGAATAARLMRDATIARDMREELPRQMTILSCREYLDVTHTPWMQGETIVVEGTQGTLLSLYHGEYPYVTSRDTTAAGLAADAGFAPTMVTDVVGVVRTFPIRTAGNSGPLPGETTFAALNRPAEYSTVTGNMRRIARFDQQAFAYAVALNRPTELAVTFADYLQHDEARRFVSDLETTSGVKSGYIGFGDTLAQAEVRPSSLCAEAWHAWTAHTDANVRSGWNGTADRMRADGGR